MLSNASQLLSIFGALLAVGVAWGAMRATVKELREEIRKLQEISCDVATLKPKVETAHEELGRVRATVDELREDVQEIKVEVARWTAQ